MCQKPFEHEWHVLENTCQESDFDPLKKEQFVCCSDHLASFAITMPVDIAFDRQATTTWFLIILNITLLLSLLLSYQLDSLQKPATDLNLTPSKKSKDQV